MNMFKFIYSRCYCTTVAPSQITSLFIDKPLDKIVKVQGWVKSVRKLSKKMTFIDVNDGSSIHNLQVILHKKKPPNTLNYHCSVSVMGMLQKSSHPDQEFELMASDVEVIGPSELRTYPFERFKDHYTGDDSLLNSQIRQNLQFRTRQKCFSSILRVRSQAKSSIQEYFKKEGFICIDTPIITRNNCEGGGEVFQVKSYQQDDVGEDGDFFTEPAYLTVSGQLHLEAAASGLSKVYNFNPAFRAETSISRRHLNEFWMIEAEESFLKGKEGTTKLMDRIESLLKTSTKNVINELEDDIHYHWSNNEGTEDIVLSTLDKSFIRIPYCDVMKILQDHSAKLERAPDPQNGLNHEHELFITNYYGNLPVFVTDWPKETKPFYMCEQEDDPNLVHAVELLIPSLGELVGGGLRQHNVEKLNLHDADATKLKWYSDIRKWGCAPSGGFGVGFERYLQFILGTQSIRDVIPFPRWGNDCKC